MELMRKQTYIEVDETIGLMSSLKIVYGKPNRPMLLEFPVVRSLSLRRHSDLLYGENFLKSVTEVK